jgi:rare lipoprotein A
LLNHKIMSRTRTPPARAIFVCLALSLAGCAESEFLASSVKSLRTPSGGDYGAYKIGNPYQIDGVTYTPRVDYSYVETGVASWYGEQFHGNRTANGEPYDMNAISAAHRTLPLPSMVRVTNLENGRALNVRINDRGPFARGRIIDMSRRAAQLLGFEQKGTAMVRVEILAEESIAMARGMDGMGSTVVASADSHPVPNAAPRVAVTSAELPPPPGIRAAPAPTANHQVTAVATAPVPVERTPAQLEQVDGRVERVPVAPNPGMFVQAGAFSQFANAHRMEALLRGVGPVQISQVDGGVGRVFRVRVGPIGSVAEADALLARVVASGVNEARIVVD